MNLGWRSYDLAGLTYLQISRGGHEGNQEDEQKGAGEPLGDVKCARGCCYTSKGAIRWWSCCQSSCGRGRRAGSNQNGCKDRSVDAEKFIPECALVSVLHPALRAGAGSRADALDRRVPTRACCLVRCAPKGSRFSTRRWSRGSVSWTSRRCFESPRFPPSSGGAEIHPYFQQYLKISRADKLKRLCLLAVSGSVNLAGSEKGGVDLVSEGDR